MPKQVSPKNAAPLAAALKNTVLPLWQQWGMSRCVVVPRDSENLAKMKRWQSTGGQISTCPLEGRRVAIKGPRNIENRSNFLARWPRDGLQARRAVTIAIILNGQADYRIGDQVLHCLAGHSVISLPGTPFPDGSSSHLMGSHRESGNCDILWMSHWDTSVACWICHSDGARHFELPGESCNIFSKSGKSIMNELIREASDQKQDYHAICDSLMRALLITLRREILDENYFQFNYQKSHASSEVRHDHLQNPISTAQEFIKDHMHEPLQISDVARYLLISRTEFTQSFKRETGKTFKEYLTDIRMEEARYLTLNTAFSIERISSMVGLQPARLRALFHHYEGLSPQQYRNKTKNE